MGNVLLATIVLLSSKGGEHGRGVDKHRARALDAGVRVLAVRILVGHLEARGSYASRAVGSLPLGGSCPFASGAFERSDAPAKTPPGPQQEQESPPAISSACPRGPKPSVTPLAAPLSKAASGTKSPALLPVAFGPHGHSPRRTFVTRGVGDQVGVSWGAPVLRGVCPLR